MAKSFRPDSASLEQRPNTNVRLAVKLWQADT
jgi:hypothetical protein